MYPSVSNINSAWSRDGVWTVLLPRTWLLTAFQSLQLNQGNICVLLPVISWLCRHIDWVPTDVGPSLLLVRRCGTLYRNNCAILFTPPPSLVVYWRHFFFQSTSMYSALEADFSALMRYINSRFTYFTYLLLSGISYLHWIATFKFYNKYFYQITEMQFISIKRKHYNMHSRHNTAQVLRHKRKDHKPAQQDDGIEQMKWQDYVDVPVCWQNSDKPYPCNPAEPQGPALCLALCSLMISLPPLCAAVRHRCHMTPGLEIITYLYVTSNYHIGYVIR